MPDTLSEILGRQKQRWEQIKVAYYWSVVGINYCQNFLREEQRTDAKKMQEKYRTENDRADHSIENI